ncbi:Hypothetical protein ACI5QL_01263 [Bacillus velezensis]
MQGLIIEYKRALRETCRTEDSSAHAEALTEETQQRKILANPRLIDALPEEYAIVQEAEGEVSDWDKERIADALSVLTESEKTVKRRMLCKTCHSKR